MRQRTGHGLKNLESIGGAEQRFTTAVWMRHHAEYVAAFIADAGNIVERAIGIRLGDHFAVESRIAENNAVIAPELRQRLGLAKVVAFHVPDGDFEHFAFLAGMSKWRVGALYPQMHRFADVLQSGIAQQRPGEQSGLAEDLKSVADTQHQPTTRGEALHWLHDRCKFGDSAGAQVVSIGKAAGDHDRIAVLEIVTLVPEKCDRLFGRVLDGVKRVVIAVRTGKDEYAEFHL